MFKIPVNIYGHKEVGKVGEQQWLVAQMVLSFSNGVKENIESFIGAVGKVNKFPEGPAVGVFVPDVRQSKFGMKLASVEAAAK